MRNRDFRGKFTGSDVTSSAAELFPTKQKNNASKRSSAGFERF
jgi:hypothetical protein